MKVALGEERRGRENRKEGGVLPRRAFSSSLWRKPFGSHATGAEELNLIEDEDEEEKEEEVEEAKRRAIERREASFEGAPSSRRRGGSAAAGRDTEGGRSALLMCSGAATAPPASHGSRSLARFRAGGHSVSDSHLPLLIRRCCVYWFQTRLNSMRNSRCFFK